MDITSLITGLTIVALCVLPFVVFAAKRKKRESGMIRNLHDLAAIHQAKINDFDIWNNSIIGHDKEKQMLFFKRLMNQQWYEVAVDLRGLAKVESVKTTMKSGESVSNHIEKLELFLDFHNKKDSIMLEFYNADFDSLTLTGELQIMDKWKGVISQSTSFKKAG